MRGGGRRSGTPSFAYNHGERKMKTKTLLCIVATAGMLAGCAAQPQFAPTGTVDQTCGETPCDVIVTVTGHPSRPPVVITVSAGTLGVLAGTKPKITWKLSADSDPGFYFRQNSIAPHTGPKTGSKLTTTQSAWNSEFTYFSNTTSEYVMNNNNTPLGTPRLYFYDIKLYHTRSGDTVWPLDPAIMNDM